MKAKRIETAPIQFSTYEDFLKETQNKSYFENQIAWIIDERKNMIYKNNEWSDIAIKSPEGGVSISLYELAKTAVSQLPVLEDLTNCYSAINLFFEEEENATHFLLLCKEISYYTIFNQIDYDSDFKTLSAAAITCAQDVGEIIDVNYTKGQGNVEIWVRTPDKEDLCMLLFNCEPFIVTFGG